jgi:hypothetical protein
MHTAAHDALNLLNVTLNKSHSSEMLVWARMLSYVTSTLAWLA